jgi:hypothetical protein
MAVWRERDTIRRLKYWEIIADNLSKGGWSWAASQRLIPTGERIWIADAQRDDGKRFVDVSALDTFDYCGHEIMVSYPFVLTFEVHLTNSKLLFLETNFTVNSC